MGIDVVCYKARTILLGRKFGQSIGDAGYDENADLNGDGKIDILDAIILATHFGEHNP